MHLQCSVGRLSVEKDKREGEWILYLLLYGRKGTDITVNFLARFLASALEN
jgi:hypothetical protein